MCEDRLSTGTRVGIAIAIFVVVFLLFSAFGYKRRQRAKAANLAYINQQPGAQTYPLQQQQQGYSPYPQPNQGPGYFPNQPYPPPNNMYPNNTGGNWGSPAPDHASVSLRDPHLRICYLLHYPSLRYRRQPTQATLPLLVLPLPSTIPRNPTKSETAHAQGTDFLLYMLL